LHVLAAIDRDIGAGHERRPVRAQVDDKTCNFFGLAEASERDLRQDLSWDSPDDSRTGVNIIAFPSSLEDRREVRTATGIRSLSSQQQGKRFIQDRDAWDLGVAYHRHRLFLRGIFPPDPKWFVSSLLHGIWTDRHIGLAHGVHAGEQGLRVCSGVDHISGTCPYRKLKTADRDRESADTHSR